jgi:hypothetical protein
LYLPPDIDQQGVVQTYITVTEIPPEDSGMLGVRMSMKHQIYVNVPYSGKYMEISMEAPNVDKGQTSEISIQTLNRGDEKIISATGKIIITDKTGKTIAQLQTDTANLILPGEKRALTAKFESSNTEPGIYDANATVDYDGNQRSTNAQFKVGNMELLMRDSTHDIIKGGIREFSVIAESIWSDEIKNARALVNISATNATTFITTSENIPPWGIVELKGYVNTQDIPLGTWDARITLLFDGGTEKNYETNVSIIKQPETQKPSETTLLPTWMFVLFASIGALLAAVVILLVIVMRKRKGQ